MSCCKGQGELCSYLISKSVFSERVSNSLTQSVNDTRLHSVANTRKDRKKIYKWSLKKLKYGQEMKELN